MKTARIIIIIVFFMTICVVVMYSFRAEPPAKAVLEKKEQLEIARIELQQATLVRNDLAMYYGFATVAGCVCLAILIISAGEYRAKVKKASVHTYKIGGNEVVIREKDLSLAWRIVTDLTTAEGLKAMAPERAFELLGLLTDMRVREIQALLGKRGLQPALPPAEPAPLQAAPAISAAVPSFGELLRRGEIAPGKPLIVGYEQGQPQYRPLAAFKSVAIAGHQGSGKTRSMGFLIACAAYACGARVFVCDPHEQHPESLRTLIRPLEQSPAVTVINPFELPGFLKTMNQTLDRRLNGTESSQQPIVFVLDELARLAKMDCFEQLIIFLERCTEETRKANITFFGGSPKWTARHFKGRADIRSCMNSMLIHKTKPSQADLLLEDSHEKKLVKELKRPGDAILVTDFGDPHIVSMPLCERENMTRIAALLPREVIQVNAKHPETPVETGETPVETFGVMVRKRLEDIKAINKTASQNKLAAAVGVSNKQMSEALNKNAVSETLQNKIMRILDEWQKQGNTQQKQVETGTETPTLLLPEVRI